VIAAASTRSAAVEAMSGLPARRARAVMRLGEHPCAGGA
jgi:hypothetical protein